MRITHHGHSCLRVDDGERSLVIDPGTLVDAESALIGASAVLITHEHFDHLDHEALKAAMTRDPSLQVWAPRGAARTIDGADGRLTEVAPGEQYTVAGFTVQTFGGQHALIHRSIPIVDNVGYLIDDVLYHPGDSFDVPHIPVACLAVPTHAPWSKLGEALDFVAAVRPERAFQIHDGLLNPIGVGNAEGHLTRVAARYGTTYEHFEVGSTFVL